MESHVSRRRREAFPLGRWAAVRLQAPRFVLALLLGCGATGPHDPSEASIHHVAPDEIIVRSDRFAFHMGARVDETWPRRAEETRVALGREAEALLDQEDALVPILARQLAVDWPTDPLDFDVVLTPDAARTSPCDAQLARRLEVTLGMVTHPQPSLFLMCVLERSMVRLRGESGLAAALGPGAELFYGCLVRYAAAALVLAGIDDKKATRPIEARLGEVCTATQLDWLGRQWVKRVRDDETADTFGARAARELAIGRDAGGAD